MSKIIKSLAIIAFVAAIAVGATTAYFSDTETSTGNTFTAGTIDIAIDDQNPWTKNYNIGDLKPGETGYINFDITNVGKNPVNVSKNLSHFETTTGVLNFSCNNVVKVSSEPEFIAEGGIIPSTGGCDATNWVAVDNVQTQIVYDLSVEVYNAEGQRIWWQEIYNANEKKSLTDVYGAKGENYVTLGMIPVNGHMKVTQSYHFSADADNKYQGDTLSFDITIKGDQLPQGDNGLATVVMENKNGAPNWDIIQGDNIQATLSYQATADTFTYSLNASVNTPNTSYTLVYPGPTGNYPGIGSKVIATGTASGNSLVLSGSTELHLSITNGKMWLVPSSTYDTGTSQFIGWDNVNNLYETALINYIDPNN